MRSHAFLVAYENNIASGMFRLRLNLDEISVLDRGEHTAAFGSEAHADSLIEQFAGESPKEA